MHERRGWGLCWVSSILIHFRRSSLKAFDASMWTLSTEIVGIKTPKALCSPNLGCTETAAKDQERALGYGNGIFHLYLRRIRIQSFKSMIFLILIADSCFWHVTFDQTVQSGTKWLSILFIKIGRIIWKSLYFFDNVAYSTKHMFLFVARPDLLHLASSFQCTENKEPTFTNAELWLFWIE